MRLLLDTHAFIWWDSDPTKLSSRALAACRESGNVLLLSVVSVWEMLIKSQLGKLTIGLPLADVVASQRMSNRLEVLSVALEHVLALESLPAYHRDPFDRLLIAQAIVEGAILISNDPMLENYPVNLLW